MEAFPQFVFKGHPESSYVLKRMMVRQDLGFTLTEQMPTLATFQPDSAGLDLLKDLICSLGYRPLGSCRLPDIQPDATYWDLPTALEDRDGDPHRPRIRGRYALPSLHDGWLRLGPGSGIPDRAPGLFDMRGRPAALVRMGAKAFRSAEPLKPGPYLVRTDAGMGVVSNLP
jgi:hypothetical protein